MTTQVFLVITDPDEYEDEATIHAALTTVSEAERCAGHLNAIRQSANASCAEVRVQEIGLHFSAAAALDLLPTSDWD